MRQILYSTAFIIVLAVAALPLFLLAGIDLHLLTELQSILALSSIGWLLVFVFLLHRRRFERSVKASAVQYGVPTYGKALEQVLTELLHEVDRKNSPLSINLVERKITSKQELSDTLEKIVALAYRLLKAESAELALFDRESGLYHSSFVLGKPFRKSAQAMLAGALDDATREEMSPDVLSYPISFAGNVLGSLRVALPQKKLPTTADQEIMRLLALQGSLALINSQYTEELLRMKQFSEESLKAKTGFLANLSHEIRGPLGIMLNAVELVLEGLCGAVTEDQVETLRMVQQNGQHLLELINDVLDYAKVESGRLSPERVPVHLNDFLKDITGVVRKQAEGKSHRLILDPPEELLAISCDRRHLRQMLINLLTNAIKYTPEGGEIRVWAERAPRNMVKINVKDNGVGIEAGDREKVFAAFERIDHAYSINQMGTGLGMPLTKRLTEVNGGIIEFSSKPKEGSHFWLLFPSTEYNPAMSEAEVESAEVPAGTGELILLIEEEEGERSMMARYLLHLGYETIALQSRLEAMEVLREKNVRLLIVDNDFIDNGEEGALESLRTTVSTGGALPVVLLSSRAFNFDIERYLRAGVDLCLIKPLKLAQLGKIVRELLDGKYSGERYDKTEVKPSDRPRRERKMTAGRIINRDDFIH